MAVDDVVRRQRSGEQVALGLVATELAETFELIRCLDTFGDGSQTEVGRQIDDGGDDALVFLIDTEALDERLVDLHERHRKATEMGERRVPGAEVVEADLHAEIPDVPELLQDVRAGGR